MGSLRSQFWSRPIEGPSLPRRDRRGGAFQAYVPRPLVGRPFSLSGDVAADVADATTALTRLDNTAASLTNTEALARLLLRAESVASSRIEGLQVSAQRLLRADVARAQGIVVRDELAREVLANVDAMEYAVHEVKPPITLDHILGIHHRLLDRTQMAEYGGVIRTQQNWIGGSRYTPLGADFVPPPPSHVHALLEDLVAFCNDDALPAVAQAAVAHAQFETIHPFVDGNGRTGRALITIILRSRGLALRATPPVSLALATEAKEYIRGLAATRFVGEATSPKAVDGMNTWLGIFAAACTRAVSDAEAFEQRVEELQTEWRARLPRVRADSAVFVLLRHLPAMPVFTVGSAAGMTGRSFAQVNLALRTLEKSGIVARIKVGARNRLFEARELIDAFTDLERRLASPDADTRISPPARAVPFRPHRAGAMTDRPLP